MKRKKEKNGSNVENLRKLKPQLEQRVLKKRINCTRSCSLGSCVKITLHFQVIRADRRRDQIL